MLTPIERTLTASAATERKAMIEILRSNIGVITEDWASASSKATYAKGAEFDITQEERADRLRNFLEALLNRAEDMNDKEALIRLKSSIRSEHSRSLNLSTLVKRQALLRDIMYNVLVKENPNMPKATAKLAVDGIVDKSIEGTVMMLEEYAELQSTLTRWLLAGPSEDAALEQSLTRFCRNAMDYFDLEFVALFAYDSESDELICQACSAKGISLNKDSRLQFKSIPGVEESFKQGKSKVFSDLPDRSQKKKRVIGQATFRHSVFIPMMRGDSPVGMMIFGDNARPEALTPDEMSIADDLAKQMIRVKENSDAFHNLSLRSRAQKVLIETAAVLQQEIESEEIYRIVATRLADLVPCAEFAFYVYDWERRVGNPVYAAGPYAAEMMADRDFPADDGIAGYVAKTRKAEIIQNTEKDPRGAQIPGTPKTNTRMLAVPVIGQKEVIGVIELQRYSPDNFTQEDAEIASMFANHASVALENAKLLKEVIRVRDEVELSMDLLTHDIANYTTPINAYFSELSKRTDLDKDVASAIEKTSRQVESIMRLVEMVRTATKLREAGPKMLAKLDLGKAIEDSVTEVRSRTLSKDIEVEMFFPGEAMFVIADEMLKDIFTNLFYSVAMSDRNQTTLLKVTGEMKKDRKKEYWWIRVAQPNKAIPDHLKGEVLKMAKSSKTELAGGFGIGLAAAKDIVNRYTGGMWVSDIVPGDYSKGCVFNIMLPRSR